MLLTRAAHHLLMIEAASAPRQAMMTCSNAMDNLRHAGIDNRIRNAVGSISGSTRKIEWRIEKDPGQETTWLHARLTSASAPLKWRIDDDTISVIGTPSSILHAYRERLTEGSFPATEIMDLRYLKGRCIEDIDLSGDGAILILSGSHRDGAIADIPRSMGEWRNAGIAYVKLLDEENP